MSTLVVLGLLLAPVQSIAAAPLTAGTDMSGMNMAGMDMPCDECPDKCCCDTAQMDCTLSFSCLAKCGGMAASTFEGRSFASFAGEAVIAWQPTLLISQAIAPPRRPPRT